MLLPCISHNNLPNSSVATIASLAPSDVVHRSRDERTNDFRRKKSLITT